MRRAKLLPILAVGGGSALFALLWAAVVRTGLSPRLAAAGWLAVGCLLGLGNPLRPAELLLLAAVLTPGLYAALSSLSMLRGPEAWLLNGRVLLALALHAALASLAVRILSRRLHGPALLLLALGVPLLFVFGLWEGSLLLAAALPACAAGVLLLIRRAHA